MFSGIVLTLLCLGTVVHSAPPSIGRVPTERWFLPKTTVTQFRTVTTTEKMRPSCIHFEPGPETCERTRMARISPTSVINSGEMMRSTVEYNPLTSELSPSPSMILPILQDDSTHHKILSPKFFDNWSLLEYFETTVTKVAMAMETKRILYPSNVVTLTINGCSSAPPDVPICEEDIILPSRQEVIMSTVVPMATDTLIAVDDKVSVTPIIDTEENTPTSNPEDMTTVETEEQGTTVEGGTTEETLPTDESKILDSQSTDAISEDNNVITTTEISEVMKVTVPPENAEIDDNVVKIPEEVTTVTNEQGEEEDKTEQPVENLEVRKIETFMNGGENQVSKSTVEDKKPEENQLSDLEAAGMSDLYSLSGSEAVETSTLPDSKKDESFVNTATTIAPQDDELSDRTNFVSTIEENDSAVSQIDTNHDLKISNEDFLDSSNKFKSSETSPEVNALPEDTVMVSVIVEDNAEKTTTIINDIIIKAQDMPTSVDNLPQVEETLSSILSLLPARQDTST